MNQQILIIDDSDKIHSLVKAVLSDQPIDVHSAANAEYGLSLAASIRPDLILLDVDMPGMDGFSAARQLKARTDTADLPIIFLTGQSSPKEKVLGFGLGAVDYVTKPFHASELLARVLTSLKTHRLLRQFEQQSLIDPLTGLWNASMYQKRLTAELSLRARTDTPFSLVKVEIGGFEQMAGQCGDGTRNEVVRRIANTLDTLRRQEDVVCRSGAATFMLILPSTTAASAGGFVDRVKAAIAEQSFQPVSSGNALLAGRAIRPAVTVSVAGAAAELNLAPRQARVA